MALESACNYVRALVFKPRLLATWFAVLAFALVISGSVRAANILISPGVLLVSGGNPDNGPDGGAFGRLDGGQYYCYTIPCSQSITNDLGPYQTDASLWINASVSPGDLTVSISGETDAFKLAPCFCTVGASSDSGAGVFVYLASAPGTEGSVSGAASTSRTLTGPDAGGGSQACYDGTCTSEGAQGVGGVDQITIGSSPDFVVNGVGFYYAASVRMSDGADVSDGPNSGSQAFAGSSASITVALDGGIPLVAPEPSTARLITWSCVLLLLVPGGWRMIALRRADSRR